MQRPDILRNPNAVVKQLTMFMTQRLQNFNILYDAVGKYNKYKKDKANGLNEVTQSDLDEARRGLVRSVTSQVVAGATIVAMKFAVDLIMHSVKGYKDDDDELSAEGISLSLLNNFIDTMVSSTLGGSEIYAVINSVFTGKKYYGVSLNGIDAFTDAVSDFVKLAQKPSLEQCNNLAESICTFLGIPLENAEKIGLGIYYHIQDAINGEFGTFNAGSKNQKNISNIDADKYIKYIASGQKTSAKSLYNSAVQTKKAQIIKDLKKSEKVIPSDNEIESKAQSSIKTSISKKFREEYIII